jgi:transposase
MIAQAETALLARLMEQGREDGADLLTLRALAEEASELGAARALERLGLHDAAARADLDDLRELLSAWRDAKRTARDAVVGWAVRVVLALMLLGLAVRLGLVALVRP